MKKLIAPIFAALLLLTGMVVPQQAAAAGPQWRSFWVDTLHQGVFNAAQVSQVVAEAKSANANVLIVQVVRRFECFCNNSTFPRSTDFGLAAGFDPLAEFIKQGHAADLEVHAWVNVNTLWSAAAAPADPKHAFNTNGPSATGANRWIHRRQDGAEKVGNTSYLDLANPGARNYLSSRIASIVQHYDVDGINLDYVRYPDHSSGTSNQWGYSDTSLQRYRQATGATGTPAPGDRAFSSFRRDQVTATVSQIRGAINDVDPSTVLSINGIAYGNGPSSTRSWESTDPYATVFQDWRGWARDGIIDAVILMNYKNEANSSHARMFAEWNNFLVTVQRETGKLMVSGPGLYLNTRADSLKQANAVTSLGLGWSGYSYANVSRAAAATNSNATKASERTALIKSLVAGPFKTPVPVPGMPWKPGQEADVYTTPGTHNVGGRQWRTECEPYSQTTRCRTEIMATVVSYANGTYTSKTDWAFNNLTYLPMMTRAEWKSNPLGFNGSWTATDGRQWRTECDTAATGRGGCRSFALVKGVVHSTAKSGGGYTYHREDTWLFNNMVRFSD